MKRGIKILSAIFFSLSAVIVIVYVAKRYLGDISPIVLPPSQNTPVPKSTTEENVQMKLEIWVEGLNSPRDLEITPGGTILVSQPSAGNVLSLPDKKIVIGNLNRPHGLAFRGGKLFIAEEERLTRYNWNEEKKEATLDKILFNLPKGGRHVTRSLVFDKNGKLFVSLGSSCDVCYENEPWLGSVIVTDEEGRDPRVFTKGLRNAVFLALNESTNEVWSTEMGRDFLGDNLPPDEINILKDGKNYGWPVCYGNKIHDSAFDKNQYVIDPCLTSEPPIYEIQAHSAPLGLAFWKGDLLVSYHGSWNRSTPVGYKVVRLKLKGNKVVGEEEFLGGFINQGQVSGRPVDILIKNEEILVSDDKKGVVYRLF